MQPDPFTPPDDASYALLRHLTSPVVAITSVAGGRRNGMISNSAQRASLVPSVQRVSLYVSKINFTHDLIWSGGVFGLHLLLRDQWELIWRLGLVSGRDGEKLRDEECMTGETGCPLLRGVRAAYECQVVNAMDAGGATFFLGEVVSAVIGPPADVMTSDFFRAHMPADKQLVYERNMAIAQKELERLSRRVEPKVWPGPAGKAGPGRTGSDGWRE
jgi:flavin reductase (DIM6/NTAB) family NADH-FMN oxidoreductase RutF